MAGHHGQRKAFLVGGRPYWKYFLEGVSFLGVHNGAVC